MDEPREPTGNDVRQNGQSAWRRFVRLWAGPLAGIGLLLISTSGVDWPVLGTAFAQIDPFFLAMAILSVLCTILAKALRWRELCRTCHAVPMGQFLDGIVVGQAANIVFPGRVGDLARVAMLGRQKQPGYSMAVGSLLAEKGIDGLMLVALMVAVVPFSPGIEQLNTVVVPIMATLTAGIFILCLWLLRQESVRAAASRLIGRMPGRRAKVWSQTITMSLTRVAEATPTGWRPWAWTLGIWILAVVTNQLLFFALHIRAAWTAAPLLLVVLQLGWLVRITPGQIGIIQGLTILTMDAYQVDQGLALTCGLLLNLIVIAPPLILCIWSLRHEGMHGSELLRAIRKWADSGKTMMSEESDP